VKSAVFTKSDYARRIGRRPSAISNYIARQQLTSPAVRADGRIDATLADAQLGVTIDPVRAAAQAGAQAQSSKPPTTVGYQAPAISGDAASLLRSRAIMARITAIERRHAFEASRGRYMLTADAEREWRTVLSGIIASIEAWFADLVAELPGDKHRNIIIIRKSWRRLRVQLAMQEREGAAKLPEYVEDAELL
jgi:hypothetical protein